MQTHEEKFQAVQKNIQEVSIPSQTPGLSVLPTTTTPICLLDDLLCNISFSKSFLLKYGMHTKYILITKLNRVYCKKIKTILKFIKLKKNSLLTAPQYLSLKVTTVNS